MAPKKSISPGDMGGQATFPPGDWVGARVGVNIPIFQIPVEWGLWGPKTPCENIIPKTLQRGPPIIP